MAHEIRIAGYKELLRLEKSEGILKKWEAFKTGEGKDEIISVSDWTGLLSDIKSFRKVLPLNSSKITEEQERAEYLKGRDTILAEPADVRAKRLGFFRLVYFGFTGKKSEEVFTPSGIPIEKMAEDIQKKFFVENPRRIFCDPIFFKPIIKSKRCNEIIMRVIDTHMMQDKFAEAKL